MPYNYICIECGTEFSSAWKDRKCCSRRCNGKRHARLHNPLKRRPAAVRFWEKVQKTDGCWVWLGCIKSNGYGSFEGVPAHRFAYALKFGEVPRGRPLHHTCKIRCCVNWDHLQLMDSASEHAKMERRKACCPKGHPYIPGSFYVRKDGSRGSCKECKRLYQILRREHRSKYNKEYYIRRKSHPNTPGAAIL